MTCPPRAGFAQVWSKTKHFRQGLRLLATSEEELDFLVPFLCWRVSEKMGFTERDGASQAMQERAGGPDQTIFTRRTALTLLMLIYLFVSLFMFGL